MDPNPTRLRALVEPEEVDLHRSVCCAGYDDCLETASRRRWRSWTCSQCELFLLTRKMPLAMTAHEAELRPQA